jgi:hypothetical protein
VEAFQRGGIVCRVVEIDSSDRGEEKAWSIRRSEGAVVLKTVDAITLEDILGRSIKWLRNHEGELVPADSPPKVAATYLSRAGEWRLPALTGVIEAPTVLSDGTSLIRARSDGCGRTARCAGCPPMRARTRSSPGSKATLVGQISISNGTISPGVSFRSSSCVWNGRQSFVSAADTNKEPRESVCA